MGDKAIHNGSNLSVSWDPPPEGATAYNVTYYRVGGAHARAAWNHTSTSLTIRCDSRYPLPQQQNCVSAQHACTAGLQGTLVDGGTAGLPLTGKTDALAVGTSSEKVTGANGTLASAQATVTRPRPTEGWGVVHLLLRRDTAGGRQQRRQRP